MVEILVNGRRGAKVIPLADDRPLVIGRKGKLRIDDRQISRQHARVVRRDDAWYVEDLGSKNGTFINQVRVMRTERVQPGDTIRIGNTSMVVRQVEPRENVTPALTPVRRHASLEIPDRVEAGKASLTLAPTTEADAGSRRWGSIVLVGMTLALLVSILFNAISYTRTVSVLRSLELTAQQRAERRDLELIEALRSDLRKPPAGFADLAATLERAALRREGNDTSRATTDRVEERFVQLHRSTSEELAEIRRTLDGLGKKLDAPPPPAPPTLPTASISTTGEGQLSSQGQAAAEPSVTSDRASSVSTAATGELFPDVVFVIDASRGLRAALPQALAQVRLARLELAAQQRCRIFVAREAGVVEILDSRLTSTASDDFTAVSDTEQDGDAALSSTRAIAMALKLSPRTLHLFTDNSGAHAGELRSLLKAGDSGAMSVNVTHFFTREFREDLKALARDHGGMYSFIGNG